MKLRNKISGEIKEFALFDGIGLQGGATLESLTKEWEDYKPVEPLIKDERIRKAVRAWAEMNDILFIHMCSRTRKENARIVGQNALGRTFTMEIDNEYEIRVRFKDYKECYTIAELCGEEE